LLALSFSPDGRRLVLSNTARQVLGWDVPTGRLVFHLLGTDNVIHGLAFSPDGRRLLASMIGPQTDPRPPAHWVPTLELPPMEADLFVQQWDAGPGGDRTFIWSADHPTHAALDHAGTRVLTQHANGPPRLWDTRTGRRLTTPYRPSDFRSSRSGDGRWQVLCVGNDLELHAVERDPARRLRELSTPDAHWHRQRAAQADWAGQYGVAAFHLGVLLRAEPRQPADRLRRGLARWANDDWAGIHDIGCGLLEKLLTPRGPGGDHAR
jgi:hypothetical protein